MAFSDNIWITRKSRINASERLNSNDFWSQLLIAYYSICLIILTIIDMESESSNFTILSLVLSILILTTSIFVVSMNYKERSLILKTSYVKMAKLYSSVKNRENKNNHNYTDLENQYNTIIEITENHSTYDYMELLNSIKNNDNYEKTNPKWTKLCSLKLLCLRTQRFTIFLFLFLIPIIIYIFVIN